MVKFRDVVKVFSNASKEPVRAVDGFNLEAGAGSMTVLLGPSGCGKTTALRILAGLETADRGEVFLDGVSVAGLTPKQRDVAMVFQQHSLLPHLTVFENLAFGLMLRKATAAEIKRQVGEAAEMLRISALLDRKPGEISGGEAQRVALGRALVRRPKVFLFDEPLSHLDAALRLELRAEIAGLKQRLGATMIFVTHDQEEAMALADRMAVMRNGSIEQVGTPVEIYRRPINRFVAGFVGSPPMSFLSGTLARKNGAVTFICAGSNVEIEIDPTRAAEIESMLGRPLVMGLRSEHVRRRSGSTDGSPLKAIVERLEMIGAESLVYFSLGDEVLAGRFPAEAGVRVGQTTELAVQTAFASFFPADPA